MKVVVHWGGGKDGCYALHKAVERGLDVDRLLTYVYREPYIFHSFKLMELQSQALGIPQQKVKIKDAMKDVYNALAELKREGIEGLVTGDIANINHKPFYENACKQIGLELITPLWNPTGDHTILLNEELSSGIKFIFGCIDTKYARDLDGFAKKWLGHVCNSECQRELLAVCAKNKLDPCGETPTAWYHTMVVDAPLFKQQIEVVKFDLKKEGKNRYIDVKEATLKQK
jgi:uncharacterized protein (TIGR00290 family)